MAEQSRLPGDDISPHEEATALKKLNAEAANVRFANRLVLITGLLCMGASILILPYNGVTAFFLIVVGGYALALSASKSPTQLQKRNLPKLAFTKDPEALGPLCNAALCADKELRTVAEATLGPLIRLHLASDSPQMKSETSALLKILSHTRNVDLIYGLLDWIVVTQSEDAVRALDRLAKSRHVPQNSALAEAVSKCRTTVIEARQQRRGGDDLLRASAPPVRGDLLLPAPPGSVVDSSNLLRPVEEVNRTN